VRSVLARAAEAFFPSSAAKAPAPAAKGVPARDIKGVPVLDLSIELCVGTSRDVQDTSMDASPPEIDQEEDPAMIATIAGVKGGAPSAPGKGAAPVKGAAPAKGGASVKEVLPVKGAAPVKGGAPVKERAPVKGGAPAATSPAGRAAAAEVEGPPTLVMLAEDQV